MVFLFVLKVVVLRVSKPCGAAGKGRSSRSITATLTPWCWMPPWDGRGRPRVVHPRPEVRTRCGSYTCGLRQRSVARETASQTEPRQRRDAVVQLQRTRATTDHIAVLRFVLLLVQKRHQMARIVQRGVLRPLHFHRCQHAAPFHDEIHFRTDEDYGQRAYTGGETMIHYAVADKPLVPYRLAADPTLFRGNASPYVIDLVHEAGEVLVTTTMFKQQGARFDDRERCGLMPAMPIRQAKDNPDKLEVGFPEKLRNSVSRLPVGVHQRCSGRHFFIRPAGRGVVGLFLVKATGKCVVGASMLASRSDLRISRRRRNIP